VGSRVALLLALGVVTLSALSQDTLSAPTRPGQSARAPQLAPVPAQAAVVPAAFRTAASAQPATLRTAASARPASPPRRTVRRSIYGVARVGAPLALRTRPRGPVSGTVSPDTEFGSPRVVSVAARRGRWVGVATTALPNNQLGWVRRDDPALHAARVGYSLHADLSERSLALRRDGRVIRSLSVAVGRPGSPTPTGRFAVTDKLRGTSYGPYYGCCILALSGHQPNTPPGWTGGDRIAIHGTDAPASVGQPASAGCLRAADADLEVLMRRVPLGTPVFIHG
jgi:lipoprotein-anchoring transpeptidase ErfK/SrfK